MMCRPSRLLVLTLATIGVLATQSNARAVTMSRADRAFIATVLQGGTFEVEAGKLALVKAAAQDVRDLGNTERHDHELVGAKLRAIAASGGIFFGTKLHPRFRERLAALARLSGQKFDDAFIADMEDIHDLDGAAFAREARLGTNRELRSFAAETYRIVRRHLGALHATGLKV